MKKQNSAAMAIVVLDSLVGSLRVTDSADDLKVVGIDLMPGVEGIFQQWAEAGMDVILLVPDRLPDDELKAAQQFAPYFQEIISYEGDIKSLLDHRAQLQEPGQTYFVAGDRVLRGYAANAGMKPAPHVMVAELLRRDEHPQFVRITGGIESIHRLPNVIPYHQDTGATNQKSVLGVASRAAVTEAILRGLMVDVLPVDVALEDLLLVQNDALKEENKAEIEHLRVISFDRDLLLVALPSDLAHTAIDLHGAHGHNNSLVPVPHLLAPTAPASNALRAAQSSLIPLQSLEIERVLEIDILDLIPLSFCPATASSFQADLDRYTGAADLDKNGPIVSRHVAHPDNARVVHALINDLNAMGYCAYTHSFSFQGKTFYNVIADLPGAGYFTLERELHVKLRDLLLKFPEPLPLKRWVEPVKKLIGAEWLEGDGVEKLAPLQLRRHLEQIVGFHPWFPWWLRLCWFPGFGSQLVIVGCHLDSTAGFEPGYSPQADPAPGADDDASGIVATLAIARDLANLRHKLRHTVRFCFFNAEEAGLVGSKAYASHLKAHYAPIKAVICSDMIGYNSDAARIFEVHAGYTDPAIRDSSVPIAQIIANWAASQGKLAPAQLYTGTLAGGGTDRTVYDGAINRSDHAAFHQMGFPAVLVSEDFFANLTTEPVSDPNPNYHRSTDMVIDPAFAADITCAVARAVKELAMT